MKRIDLHIHTISTGQDSDFEFCLNSLVTYVNDSGIDAIAITNHNVFDIDQFQEIVTSLQSTKVFPGIEVDFAGGHLLVIADDSEVLDFANRAKQITEQWNNQKIPITLQDFRVVFPDLSRLLLIPHYRKRPEVPDHVIGELKPDITAGEVTSPRKFKHCINDQSALVPVIFSDCRMSKGLTMSASRTTYIDAQETTFAAVRMCLADKSKVSLSADRGHDFFDALPNGLKLSNGLNVVIGERSSGKTYTLDLLSENFDSIKYVKQFALLERDPERDAKQFEELLTRGHSLVTQEYLSEFRDVVDDITGVSIEADEKLVQKFLQSVKQYASEVERKDSFSNTRLYDEAPYPEVRLDGLKGLIASTKTLIETTEYRAIIEEFIPFQQLTGLIVRLMNEYAVQKEVALKQIWVNDLVESIQRSLKLHTATPEINHVDLYQIAFNRSKVQKFSRIANDLREETKITEKHLQGFTIVAKIRPYAGAGELKTVSGKKIAFSNAFQSYLEPYSFLKELKTIEGLEPTDYYKFFAKVEYNVLNRYGFEVSGGERSEFRLLQQIADAQNYDMLLIDEPESSFDNGFLRDEVNKLIKDISTSIPVVVVTHNNTVGASIKPNYVIYTKREPLQNDVEYRFYCGTPSDKELVSPDGRTIKNFDVLMNCLEAGETTYTDRGHTYEILKD